MNDSSEKGRHRVPIIELEDVSVKRDAVILKDVTWRVDEGQHWCILGANGSGKSTLLNVLTAYIPASAGKISVCGRRYGAFDWREMRKQIGLVASSLMDRINMPVTALEVVVSGKNAQLNRIDTPPASDIEKARAILRDIECEHLSEQLWFTLSQGEKQRIAIGRALMADYRILLLDEPCAGLDPIAREKFLKFIDRLTAKQKNVTIIYVTHHIEEIVPAFSHVLILHQGAVLAAGEKPKILTSENLSAAYDSLVRVIQSNGRYQLEIK